jgi:protein-disulfide isomerase
MRLSLRLVPSFSYFMRTLLLAGSLVAASSILPAQANPFSDSQKQAIEGMFKDFLMKNPEAIQDALMELDRRQQSAQEEAKKSILKTERSAIFEAQDAIVVGNPKGNVTLVEFFDYNCGFCKRSLNDLQEMIKSDPQLRVVLKDFPVLGPESVEASRVTLAAKRQLKAEQIMEFHTRLMNQRGRINGEKALQLAREMGLDAEKIQTDMNSPAIKTTLESHMRLADKLSITGTPAFILGESVIVGAVGVAPLRKAVASLRECGKTTC